MRPALTLLALATLAGCDSGVPAGRDGASLWDAGRDVPGLDVPGLDAPLPDVPGLDAPLPDVPGLDAPAPPDVPTPAPDVPPPPDAGAPCPTYGGPVRPPECPLAAEVVVYTQNGWNALGDAIAADLSACAEYWISIPAVSADQTTLRAGEAERMHARGPSIHAMAELNWRAWSDYRASTGASWTEIGRLFRQRMVDAGYCVESGDTWAINEAPSGARLDSPGVRDGLEEVTAALHDGMPGMPPARGTVFVVNFGHGTSTTSTYRSNLEGWLTDGTFWGQMNLHVRFWAQEVYTDPGVTCVPGSTLAARGGRIQDFVMHPSRLASAAPSGAGAGTAETYFGRAYVPLMNAFFGSDGAYGHTMIPLDDMEALISEQVRAVRLWADSHPAPDGRIGFAFGSNADPTEWARTGARLAGAIRGAYGRSATAAGACYEGAVSVYCDCSVAGAAFTDVWTGLGTW